MPNALIYVIDMAKREEYSVLKNFLAKAGYDVRTAIGSRDTNINYDVDLMDMPRDEVAELAEEFDLLALAGGYKIYYYVLRKKPPLKIWDLNIDVDKLNALVEQFFKSGKLLVAPLAVPGHLAQLGFLKGRDATVYPTTELVRILKDNGARFVNRQVVRDKNVITVKDVTAVGEKEFLSVFRETT
jgi:putative intracellular protease/amidase